MHTRRLVYLAESTSRILDGCIVTIALLEVVDWGDFDPLAAPGLLLLTLLSVMLAKTYAHIIGTEAVQHVPMSWRARGRVLVEMTPILFAAGVPLVITALTRLGLAPPDLAAELSQLLLVGVMFVLGFLSRIWSGGSVLRSVGVGLSAAAIGLALAEFKVLADSLKK